MKIFTANNTLKKTTKRDFVCFYSVWKWAYQDDLLPKEGGEQ